MVVQARQIYVFAHADILGWWPDREDRLARAIDTMIRRFYQADGAPGFVHSVFSDGRVAYPARDTYAHAFVLFALAWALRRGNDARIEALVLETLAFLDGTLACPGGGYLTRLPITSLEQLQNPHMHLFEALLALHEATACERYLARAGDIFRLFFRHFLVG